MEIVDAQIHAPLPVHPPAPGTDPDVQLLLKCEMAREAMDCVGVDAALLNSQQEVLDFCVARYPERFAGCVTFDVTAPDAEGRLDAYLARPGMRAIRVQVVEWQTRTVRPDAVCTWCGRPPSEVGKLIAGPKVYICDGCVAHAEKAAAGRAAGAFTAPGTRRVAGRCAFCNRRAAADRTLVPSTAAAVCTACLTTCREILDPKV